MVQIRQSRALKSPIENLKYKVEVKVSNSIHFKFINPYTTVMFDSTVPPCDVLITVTEFLLTMLFHIYRKRLHLYLIG